jgi:hypothetical protein
VAAGRQRGDQNIAQLHAPQTKILDDRTNVWDRMFEVLFKGVSTRFGLRSFETYFERVFPNVRSDLQHLRLGSMQLRTHDLSRLVVHT